MSGQPLIFFYSDQKCENEVFIIKFDKITLVGQIAETTIWAKNISGCELINVQIRIIGDNGIVDSDVTLEPSAFSLFNPEDIREIKVTFNPSPTRTIPLRGNILVDCVKVIRA